MMEGGLIAESLRVGTNLESLTLIVRKISRFRPGDTTADQPDIWTLLDFEADEAEADQLARAFAAVLDEPGWYVNFQSSTTSFVVFPGRILGYPRGDKAGRADAEAYGRQLAIPESQLDWTVSGTGDSREFSCPPRYIARSAAGRVRANVLQVKAAAEAARRFLVARHFLAPARSVAGGLDGVLEVVRKFGSIQFDPNAVAGRNHDLVLHARVAGYEPAWCDVLYERREIFETTNKALSLVPASEFPWFRLGFGRKGPRFHAAILAENAAVAERVLERIRAEGPLSALDFEPEHGVPKDWFGMPENVVRAVLEAYTVTSVIGLARREGNRRYYDLLERLLPAGLLAQEVPVREQLKHKLLSRYRAHGLLGAGGAGGTFDRIANPDC